VYKPIWINDTGWEIGYLFPNKRKQVKLIVNSIVNDFKPVDLNLFWATEPDEAVPGVHKYIINNWPKYDYVISCFDDILTQCPNARKLVYYSPWITEDWALKEKQFKLSFLCGWKNWTTGHKLRHVVFNNQGKLTIPKQFFMAIPVNQKIRFLALFENTQYNLCIENVSQNNFFTEKLIDCFLTKTIPVYWGCPNIGEYFDVNGIILFGEEKDFYSMLNNLTPDYYNQHLDSVESNYNKIKQMVSDIGEAGYKLIDRKIDELLEEKFGHS